MPQLPPAPGCRCLCAPCPPDAGWGLRNDATVPGTFSPISGCVASTLTLDPKKNTLSDLLIGGKGELRGATPEDCGQAEPWQRVQPPHTAHARSSSR